MAEENTDGDRPPLVPGVHRTVRVLPRSEGPFEGVLVTAGHDVAVRQDAAMLAGWEGWRYAGAEHVAGPLDVVRRVDGHDVLLPWCTERVQTFLDRRAATGRWLSSGETVTVAVSLLRGLAESSGHDVARTGRWWLTDGGRPLLVVGTGDDSVLGAVEILAQLSAAAETALRRVLARVVEGIEKTSGQPRIPAKLLRDAEGVILEIAAPRPLDREDTAPALARDVLVSYPTLAPADRGDRITVEGDADPGRRSRRNGGGSGGGRVSGGGSGSVLLRRDSAGGTRRSHRVQTPPRGEPRAATRDAVRAAGSRVRRLRDVLQARGAPLLRDHGDGQVREAGIVRRAGDPGRGRGLRSRLRARTGVGGEGGGLRTRLVRRPRGRRERTSDRPPVRRRALLLLGGAVVALVLTVGLLWPDVDSHGPGAHPTHQGGETSADEDSRSDQARGEGAGDGEDSEDAVAHPRSSGDETAVGEDEGRTRPASPAPTDSPGADGPVEAVPALLAAITRCRRAGDDGCSVAVAPESTGAIEALRVFEGEPPAVELVDEYGDVAVLRLTAAAAPSARTEEEPRRSTHERIVVLRRQDDRWLVRDVYDVADQPS